MLFKTDASAKYEYDYNYKTLLSSTVKYQIQAINLHSLAANELESVIMEYCRKVLILYNSLFLLQNRYHKPPDFNFL